MDQITLDISLSWMLIVGFCAIMGTTIGLFLWGRSESRNDFRALNNKIDRLAEKTHQVEINLKSDISKVRAELKEDIQLVRTELKEDILKVRAELKEDIHLVRTELKEEISKVRTELKEDISKVRTELKEEIRKVEKEVIWIKFQHGFIPDQQQAQEE